MQTIIFKLHYITITFKSEGNKTVERKGFCIELIHIKS